MKHAVHIGDEIQSGLAAVSDVLANASTCFDVWFELQNGAKRDKYEPVVESYSVFFETTVIAHLIAMSTLIYPLLETRNDTHNIPRLIRDLRTTGKDHARLSAVEAKLQEIRPIWVKVSRIRNEVFGHRSRALFPAQVFAQLQLGPEQIGKLIRDMKDILVELAAVAETIVSSALSLSATDETADLMSVLAIQHAP